MTARATPGHAGIAPPPHPHRGRLYTLIGLMQFFWSANFLVGKIALREFPASLAAGIRVTIAALGMLPLYFWKSRGRAAWTRRDVPIMALLGLIGVSVNQCFFVVGLSRTSVAHSAIFIGMTPIWVLLIAAARGLEPITPRKLGGMLIALFGVALLSVESGRGHGPTLAGDAITTLAASAFALYTVLGKELNHRYDPVTLHTFVFGFGAFFLIPVLLWQAWSFPFAGISGAGWLAVLYMGLFPSLFCYLVFYYALGYLAASRLSALSYLQPVAATSLGVVLLGERVTAPLVIGGAIIFSGVYLTERG